MLAMAFAAASLVVAQAIAAQGPVAAPASADTIKIGLSGPFTGGSAPMGESMRNGKADYAFSHDANRSFMVERKQKTGL